MQQGCPCRAPALKRMVKNVVSVKMSCGGNKKWAFHSDNFLVQWRSDFRLTQTLLLCFCIFKTLWTSSFVFPTVPGQQHRLFLESLKNCSNWIWHGWPYLHHVPQHVKLLLVLHLMRICENLYSQGKEATAQSNSAGVWANHSTCSTPNSFIEEQTQTRISLFSN